MRGALMTQASRKAEWERGVFTKFATVAGLQVVPGSVESRPSPEPDILCELADRGADDGGRCRIRTCDPFRVNRLKVVGRPTLTLSSPRNHWRSRSDLTPTFGRIWHRFSSGWVQIGSNV